MRFLKFLENLFDKVYLALIRLFFKLPEPVYFQIGKMFMIWIKHITHVVFIYTILRLLLFVTFNFKFEFLLGFSFLITGVFISYYFDLKEDFYKLLAKFIAKFYSDWKFDVRIVISKDGKTFKVVLKNPSPQPSLWDKIITFLPRMWYRWSVIYAAFYLIEYYFLTSMGFVIIIGLFFFKKYLLAYLILFFINSGKLVAGLGFIGYENFYNLRDQVYYSRKYGLNPFFRWTIFWLEHRFLLFCVSDSSDKYVNLFMKISRSSSNPIERLGFTIKEYRDAVFGEWIAHCINYGPYMEIPGKSIDHLYWSDEVRKEYPKLYYEMDRLKTVANVLSGLSLLYLLIRGFFN